MPNKKLHTTDKKIVIIGDLHSGGYNSPADPDFVTQYISKEKAKLPIYWYEKFKHFVETIGYKPDILIVNGEAIDGYDSKGNQDFIWTSQPDEQIENAILLIKLFKPKKVIVTQGNDYHVVSNDKKYNGDKNFALRLKDKLNCDVEFHDSCYINVCDLINIKEKFNVIDDELMLLAKKRIPFKYVNGHFDIKESDYYNLMDYLSNNVVIEVRHVLNGTRLERTTATALESRRVEMIINNYNNGFLGNDEFTPTSFYVYNHLHRFKYVGDVKTTSIANFGWKYWDRYLRRFGSGSGIGQMGGIRLRIEDGEVRFTHEDWINYIPPKQILDWGLKMDALFYPSNS